MTETRLPLSSLTRGDRFLGGDGQYWTVLSRNGGKITAIRQGRSAFTAPETDNLVVVTNRDNDDKATAAISAVVEADPDSVLVAVDETVAAHRADPIRVAAQYASIHEIRSHIHLLHGEYAGDIRTSKALSAAHAEMHAEGHMKVPHTHGQAGE